MNKPIIDIEKIYGKCLTYSLNKSILLLLDISFTHIRRNTNENSWR